MPPKSKKPGQLRTIDAIAPDGQTIAPRSLIEVSGTSNWTAETHKIWWTLLDHAWGARMDTPGTQFEIDTAALRFGGHKANDRLSDHLLRLQKTVLIVPVEGKRVLKVQMLGSTVMGKDENEPGVLRYDWPVNLVKVLRNPAKYGKIELKTVTAMRSAYAIRLYTVVAARFAERHNQPRAELTLGELRDWLSVPDDKLVAWSDLKKRAIDPALNEVNALCPLFSVQIEPVKVGKAVRRVVVTWDAKPAYSAMEQLAVDEVNRHKAGRGARVAGTVEGVVERPCDKVLPRVMSAAIAAGLTRRAVDDAAAAWAKIYTRHEPDMTNILQTVMATPGFENVTNKAGYLVKATQDAARWQLG